MSYPNQLKIQIHKPKYDDDYVDENGAYLQIGIKEWQEAYRSLKGNASAMGMYFYLASNADGFGKYLSKADFENALGKSKSSYHRAIDLLKEKGYIYKDQSGSLNFATTPHENCEIELHKWEDQVSKEDPQSSKTETAESQKRNSPISNPNTEINKINSNKDNKENRELKKASPSSTPSSSLREIIAPNGYFKGGEYEGQWLEDIVPNLWGLSRLARIEAISKNTNFSQDEAQTISYSILDYRNRKLNTIREVDFYRDIFFIGE